MPIAWFICKYNRKPAGGFVKARRSPAVFEMIHQVRAEGGDVAVTEVLGGYAIAKVRASTEMLSSISSLSGVTRLPKSVLTENLSDLSATQKSAIRNKLIDMGYSLQEIKDKLGDDLGNKTLADVLRFAATRRLRPRYDEGTDAIICDGPLQPVTPIEYIDDKVK